ncbi:hypothetical protein KVR01_010046 [Diaporthe batatas]|uniref:uncharacterized protein n=1 Tax=Diaporthe batatas TaxID=748121 RepID=UPI001D04EAA1|nr:uncharacterized protein KVR01_010046 [Diaporthe batatas]KAG8160510.1 hypothetical protein KVR01_010046 [Diaporthe batatas]
MAASSSAIPRFLLPQSGRIWRRANLGIHNRRQFPDPDLRLGTLASLAIFVATENFKSNTPFADMLPESSDYWEHPIVSLYTLYDVWRLTQLHNSAIVAEKRKKNVDDVVKRAEYRKAHGLDKEGGFGNWTARDDPQAPQAEPGKRDKWLGIF